MSEGTSGDFNHPAYRFAHACYLLARPPHPARPARRSPRPRAAGARGAVEQDFGLRHGCIDRGGWRPVADELVRAAGTGGNVRRVGWVERSDTHRVTTPAK